MHIHHPTTLTHNDHAVLERLMCTLSGNREPVAALARRKLETAVIIHPDRAPDDLVTSGRLIRYSVNGVGEAEHLLTWDQHEPHNPSELSLQQPFGLALLGLRTGQSIVLPADDSIGSDEVTVVSVAQAAASQSASAQPVIGTSGWYRVAIRIGQYARSALARLQKGRTEAALMRLSDATLKDIGITRGEIAHVADVVAGLKPAPTAPYPKSERRRLGTGRRRPLPFASHGNASGQRPSDRQVQRA